MMQMVSNEMMKDLNAGEKLYKCSLCHKKFSGWGNAYKHGLSEVSRYGLKILKIVSLFV